MRIELIYTRPLTRYGIAAGTWDQVTAVDEGYAQVDGTSLDIRGLDATQRRQITTIKSGGAEATLQCEPPNKYTLIITQAIAAPTVLPADTGVDITTFPYFAVGSAPRQSQTARHADNVPPRTDPLFAAQYKSRIQAIAEKFATDYDPFWQIMESRLNIGDNYTSTDTLETAARNRANSLGDHFRSWIGLCAICYWYMLHDVSSSLSGLTLTQRLLNNLVVWGEREVNTVGVKNWYGNANYGAFQGYHGFRQVWRTDTSTWRGDTAHLYSAPDADTWNQLRTLWQRYALFDQYPPTPSISIAINKGPDDEDYQEENVLTATLTDPAGAVTGVTYQWQRLASGTISDISGATRASYTLVQQDVDNQVRCLIKYTNINGIKLATVNDWSPEIA